MEPKRAAATISYAFLAVLLTAFAVVARLYRSESWPEEWRLSADVPKGIPSTAAAVAAFLALTCLVAAVSNGRRWHIARVVRRWSDDPRLATFLPDNAWTPAAHPADVIPPLDVTVTKARKLPKPRARLRRVTRDHNVVGDRPLQIAYLRLFENQPRMRTFIQGSWREFGYVHLLRSATSATPAEYRQVKKSHDASGLFISSREQLLPVLDRGTVQAKGRRRLKGIGPTTIKVRDKYGSYGVHALLCHGVFWKAAVEVLLERVDLVALDLSGFLPENLGTSYELQRAVDRFPVERVVFLADPRTNHAFIAEQLQAAWSQMAAGSPNAVPQRKEAVVVVTDTIARSQSTQTVSTGGGPGQAPRMHVQSGPVQVRLVARRKETRGVVALAQGRINESMPAGRD